MLSYLKSLKRYSVLAMEAGGVDVLWRSSVHSTGCQDKSA